MCLELLGRPLENLRVRQPGLPVRTVQRQRPVEVVRLAVWITGQITGSSIMVPDRGKRQTRSNQRCARLRACDVSVIDRKILLPVLAHSAGRVDDVAGYRKEVGVRLIDLMHDPTLLRGVSPRVTRDYETIGLIDG